MPAFYPRPNMPRQLPLTPPEFVPSYHSGCGGMPYQQSAYAGQSNQRQQDDSYDFVDRYGQLAIAMPPMYPQAGTYLSNAPPALPPPASFYEPLNNAMPPMHAGNQMEAGVQLQQQQHQQAHDLSRRPSQQVKEEKPVGGVSAKLDYDMDLMTDFVCDMALQLITPGRMMPPSFRKWVHQVLCATRLPSATILLSLFYLSHRMPMLPAGHRLETDLFRLLTISLVLGSKFLDDNTFINRSWSEVSGIPVTALNQMEMDWLVAIDFKLHRDPGELRGWTSWSGHWKDFERHAAARGQPPNKLSPIDTSVTLLNKPLPPLPAQSFSTSPYEFTPKSAQPSYHNMAGYHYDPWRSSQTQSPASAPITGPTTPEYYGATSHWGPEGYSRRTMFGFPPLTQPANQSQHQASHYGPPSYNAPYPPPVWNNHGVNCGCMYCTQRHSSYMVPPGFAPRVVAV